MIKMVSKNVYKYSYDELQEKYKDNELFHDLEDAQLAIFGIMELLRMGKHELIDNSEVL